MIPHLAGINHTRYQKHCQPEAEIEVISVAQSYPKNVHIVLSDEIGGCRKQTGEGENEESKEGSVWFSVNVVKRKYDEIQSNSIPYFGGHYIRRVSLLAISEIQQTEPYHIVH